MSFAPSEEESHGCGIATLAGGPIAWTGHRQSIMALSTAEGELVEACLMYQRGKGITSTLRELHIHVKPVHVVDN